MDNVFQIKIKNDKSVFQLKDKITNLYKIPIQNQRLIFQGKLMKDEEKLSFYKITNQCVVHLVARDLEEAQPRNEQNTTSSTSIPRNQPQQSGRIESVLENRIPLLFVPVRTNQRRRRVMLPHYDISECFEALYQNMITIDNLTECKTKFNKDNPKTEAFDLLRSKYEVGQWIDAKDTIDQWLESQVIQVQDNKAYIHYNGWGTRWDEWIDFDSPRMKHFKFYTLQPPSSSFMSPYPGVPCDSNIEPQSRSIDSFFYLEKTKTYIADLLKVMERLCELRKKDKIMIENNYLNAEDQELLFLTTQMIPFMDRVGRMLTDMSLQFSHLVLNPNLYPQMLMGYKRNQMFNIDEENNKIEIEGKEAKEAKSIKDEHSDIKKEESLIPNANNTNANNELINSNIPQEQKPNDPNSTSSNNQITQTPLTNSIQEMGSELIPNRQSQSTSTGLLTEQHNLLTRRFNLSINESTMNNNNNNQELSSIQTNLGYNLASSSNELPFVQRVFSSFTRSDRIISPSSHIAKLNLHEKEFPKVNLQLPALLSNGEVMAMTGSFPYSEPNFDIYVHTLHTQPSARNESNTTNTNNANENSNTERANNQNMSIGTLTEINSNRENTEQMPQTSQTISTLSIIEQNQTQTQTQTQMELNPNMTQVNQSEINNNPLQPHRFFKDKYTQTDPKDLE